MLRVSNAQLQVDLLDPVRDRSLLGPRFCWGGYIWQVSDHEGSPLLTGPEWPKFDPTPFNGQGLPESFRHRTREGNPLTWQGDRGVALGIGELSHNGKGELEVSNPCVWEIDLVAEGIRFRTQHSAGGYRYEIDREVTLEGRRLHSRSRLRNRGESPLALQWFAHPFFALTDRLIEVEVPAGSTLPDNPGFTLRGTALRPKRPFNDEKDGHLDCLALPPTTSLTVTLTHPTLAFVRFFTDFAPDECFVWANGNTFSIEPYRMLALAPGETQAWALRYEFGPMK